MIALLVKPKLLSTKRFNKVLIQLADLEPVTLCGNDNSSIKNEIAELWERDPGLTVVACGGDGTVHLALNSLPDLSIPIGICRVNVSPLSVTVTFSSFGVVLTLVELASTVALDPDKLVAPVVKVISD